jgi:hypothetical protein
MASVFRGGITSLTELVERRRFIERLNNSVDTIRSTNTVERFQIRARRNYQQLFDANIERIGILDAPLPDQICRIYIYTSSAIEACSVTLGEDLWSKSPQEVAAFLEDLALLLEEICQLGKKAVSCIDSIYPKRDVLTRLTHYASLNIG